MLSNMGGSCQVKEPFFKVVGEQGYRVDGDGQGGAGGVPMGEASSLVLGGGQVLGHLGPVAYTKGGYRHYRDVRGSCGCPVNISRSPTADAVSSSQVSAVSMRLAVGLRMKDRIALLKAGASRWECRWGSCRAFCGMLPGGGAVGPESQLQAAALGLPDQ